MARVCVCFPGRSLDLGGGTGTSSTLKNVRRDVYMSPNPSPDLTGGCFHFRTRVRSRLTIAELCTTRLRQEELEQRRERPRQIVQRVPRTEAQPGGAKKLDGMAAKLVQQDWGGAFSRGHRGEISESIPNYNYDRRGSYSAARPAFTSL